MWLNDGWGWPNVMRMLGSFDGWEGLSEGLPCVGRMRHLVTKTKNLVMGL